MIYVEGHIEKYSKKKNSMGLSHACRHETNHWGPTAVTSQAPNRKYRRRSRDHLVKLKKSR